MSTNGGFLPENYEAPSSGGFTKLEPGENRFRILSNPLLFWIIWENGKASRVPYLDGSGKPTDKPKVSEGEKNSVRHGWAVKVFNYKTGQMEILELTQVGVIAALTKHANDTDWGHPKGYDVVINKKGSGLDTEYSFLAKPHKEVSGEVKAAYEATPIDLDQLLKDGGNPFVQGGGSPASTPQAAPTKVVTPENWAPGDPAPAGYTVSADGTNISAGDRPF